MTAGRDHHRGLLRASSVLGGATPAFDRGASLVFEIGPSDLYIVNKAGASEKVRNLERKIPDKKKGLRYAVEPRERQEPQYLYYSLYSSAWN